jgi:GNAT superfamily N-acetyltransferase
VAAALRRDFNPGATHEEAAMPIHIRRATAANTSALAELAVLAWTPVFASFQQTFSPKAYAILYPDWQTQQREVVERICNDAHTTTLLAEAEGTIAGFLAYTLNHTDLVGTVELLAVHPAHQHQGIATALNLAALDQMCASGMKLAGVSTGGDPGHAPARRAYEKAGYTAFPNVWYYQPL